MTDKQYFGEYGPYTVSENGIPDFNEVVIEFLARSNVGQQRFGDCYGRAVKGEPYTRIRIYQMTRDKSFPTDPKRRWILAKLLQIPPFLIVGEAPLDSLLQLPEEPEKPQSTPQTIAVKTFDFQEYSQALDGYWKLHRLSTVHQSIGELKAKVARLEKEALYGEPAQRKELITLLCGYHMLLSGIAGDDEKYARAILHLNRAFVLAKTEKLYRLQAAILCRRGWVFKDRGEIAAMLGDFDNAHKDFAFATDDFTLAQSLEKYLSPGIHGSILMSLGQLQANVAQNPWMLHRAIKEIDKAETFVGGKSNADGVHFIKVHFITLEEEQYHRNKAAAYLAAPVKFAQYPRDARRELRDAQAIQSTAIPKRRLAYDTLLAKSYFVEGEYEASMKSLEAALKLAKGIHSGINLARMAEVLKGLKESDFGKNNMELVALEIEILKTQYPGLLRR